MINIKLNNLEEINGFLEIIQECKGKVSILTEDSIFDAKSTLSFLSLDLTKDLKLKFEKSEDQELIEKWIILQE